MDSEAACLRCNICEADQFGHGPSKRLSVNGRLPRCEKCNSLERHRIARRVFTRLRPFLERKRCLQFSWDPGLDKHWFEELLVSVWKGENSLDMQAIDLPDGRCDWIYSSHVLNHVPDQAAALRDMLRVVGNHGFVALSVGGTVFNYATRPSDRTFGRDYQFVLYGTEFADDIQAVLPDVGVLELVTADPCTASIDSIYLYSRAEQLLRDMAQQAAPGNIHVRVFPPRSRTASAVRPAVSEPQPATGAPKTALLPCNICGSSDFVPGPSNRRSAPHDRLPRCGQCSSLERHRVMRRVFDALTPTYTRGKRLLQFEDEPVVAEEWFDEVVVSGRSGQPRLDVSTTGLPGDRYDWVLSSHLLNDLPEDRAPLREMLRVAGSDGMVALSVRGTTAKYEKILALRSEPDLSQVRQYHGNEFVDDVRRQLPDVSVLELVCSDPCTASVDAVYFCSQNSRTLEAIGSLASRSGVYVHLFPAVHSVPPTLAARAVDWDRLQNEIRAWNASGHRARFWVRDRDAATYSETLAELAELCREENVPLALAVIPQRVAPDLARAVLQRSDITILQHGFDHRNRSATEPSSEFPDERPLREALDSVRSGWRTLVDHFDDRAIPVFVPPWGTCSSAVRRTLPDEGFIGFSGSQVGPFRSEELWRRGSEESGEGLRLASAHISVNRSKQGDTSALPTGRHVTFLASLVNAIRTEGDDPDEPIGIMTHSWGVDREVRDFLRQLFRVTRAAGAEWVSARELFGRS